MSSRTFLLGGFPDLGEEAGGRHEGRKQVSQLESDKILEAIYLLGSDLLREPSEDEIFVRTPLFEQNVVASPSTSTSQQLLVSQEGTKMAF